MTSRLLPVLARLGAATLAAAMFLDAALAHPARDGASLFGNPPELAVLWAAAALGWAWVLLRAPDRLALARRLTLALLASTLLAQRGVSAGEGLRLAVLGGALALAAPALRLRPAGALALLALLAALPALAGTRFPQGGVIWLGFVLPAAGLALLLPSLFAGERAVLAARTVVAGTSLLCGAALASYLTLADGLALPLESVLGTRLRPLGLHPNLAVPHLVATLLLGAALLARPRGTRWRAATAAALLPVALALLGVASRTGWLSLALGAALLGCGLSRLRVARWAALAAPAAIALLLALPLTGATDATVLRSSSSMVDKAVSFRSAMWTLGRENLAAAPWHGHGPGTTFLQGLHAEPGPFDGLPTDDHPHSVVLAVGGALGWPGLLALLALFLASLRLPAREAVLAHGCRAALLAMWAANAIDLGGAHDSLYPSLAFVLLGLFDAACRPGDAAPAASSATRSAAPGSAASPASARAGISPASRARSRATAGLATAAGALLVLCGAALQAGDRALAAAERSVAALEGPTALPGSAAREEPAARDATPADAESALARAVRWRPFDPGPHALAAQLAVRRGDRDGAERALAEARRLFPDSAALAFRLAAVQAHRDPLRPSVLALLQESLRLDPRGPQAWRSHVQLSIVHALAGDREASRRALVEALTLNPLAAAELPHSGEGADLLVEPGGAHRPAHTLAELRGALARRRDELAASDPTAAARLRLREVELLQSFGEHDLAESTAAALLADTPHYLALRQGQSHLAAGRIEEALESLSQAATGFRNFWTDVDRLSALALAPRTTPEAFEEAWSQALRLLGDEADVIFSLPSVKRLLDARRRWEERRGDAVEALRYADALAFARR